mgnify:CR=1 FL=1|tara:strand:+ start:139 stop:471 length:333 start_codon:yes stop_codon:yes gene_type:complete
MNTLNYLYNLTLSNYIENEEILNNPLFETMFLSFVSSNMLIATSPDLTHDFIICLHYELDKLFYRIPKPDSKFGIQNQFFMSVTTRSRINAEAKKLSKKVRDTFLQLSKE